MGVFIEHANKVHFVRAGTRRTFDLPTGSGLGVLMAVHVHGFGRGAILTAVDRHPNPLYTPGSTQPELLDFPTGTVTVEDENTHHIFGLRVRGTIDIQSH